MPTVDRKRIFKVGGSIVTPLPSNFVSFLQKKTGNKNPDVDIYGDTVLIVIPTGVNLDKITKNGVIKLLEEIAKMDKKENKKNVKRKSNT